VGEGHVGGRQRPAFELGGGDGSIGDFSFGGGLGGGGLGGGFDVSLGFGSPPPPATTPADSAPLSAVMPQGVSASYDPSTGLVSLHIPPELYIVRPLSDIPISWRLQLGLPAGLTGISNAVRSQTAARLGIAASKIQSGAVTASSRAGAALVDAPRPSPNARPMALFNDSTTPAKKTAIVVAGVGALGTLTLLAWQAMR